MTAAATLAAINASLALAETLIPRVADLVKTGEVTKAEQAEVLNRYTALREKLNEHFAGPEWEVES